MDRVPQQQPTEQKKNTLLEEVEFGVGGVKKIIYLIGFLLFAFVWFVYIVGTVFFCNVLGCPGILIWTLLLPAVISLIPMSLWSSVGLASLLPSSVNEALWVLYQMTVVPLILFILLIKLFKYIRRFRFRIATKRV